MHAESHALRKVRRFASRDSESFLLWLLSLYFHIAILLLVTKMMIPRWIFLFTLSLNLTFGLLAYKFRSFVEDL